jgi:hypothetical protein
VTRGITGRQHRHQHKDREGINMRRHIPVTFILTGLIALGAMLLPALASAATGGISGKVTDTEAHAISGASVCLYTEGETQIECKTAEASGEYKFEGLAAAKYRVGFSAGGFANQYYKGVSSLSEATLVEVTTSVVPNVNAELEEVGAGSVTGRVISAFNGQGAAGVEACDGSGRCAKTNGNGEYTISGLSVGSHTIFFSSAEACEEEQGEKIRCQPESNFISGEGSVKVKVSPTATLNIALKVGGQISGTVTNASITHPGLAKVEVCATRVTGPEEYGGRNCAYTNSSGQYTINGLVNGFYKVEFSGYICSIPKKGRLECSEVYITQYYQGQQTFKNGATVTVTTGANTGGINESLREAFPTTPAVTVAPALTGTVLVGSALTCSQGSWSHEPTYLLYQWLRNGTVITGQTGSTYTLQTADLGSSITCSVTAGNGAGAVSATSKAVAVPKPLVVAGASASVKGNVAMLKLTCTGAAACSGTLKLLVPVRHGKRTTNITAGTARFSIAVGKSATIRVRLTAKGRSLVGKAGKRGLKVKLSGSGVKGRTLVLKTVQAKKGKKKK